MSPAFTPGFRRSVWFSSAHAPDGPFSARVEADLADDVDLHSALTKGDRIVAVEPSASVGLIGHGKDRGTRGGLGYDVNIAIGDSAGQTDRQGCDRVPLKCIVTL